MRLPRIPSVGDTGPDILAHKRALAKVLGGSRLQTLMLKAPWVRSRWFQGNADWVRLYRRLKGMSPGDKLTDAVFRKLLETGAYDAYGKSLLEKAAPRVPALGPVEPGGRSILEFDLTHVTGGLSAYPAFDGPFGAGKTIIAPEKLTVTRLSSARRRDGNPNGKAFYATGVSGLRYWFGHIEQIPALGAVIPKGGKVGVVSANHEVPHLHVGIDAQDLIGKPLFSRTDYQHGGPTIGEQLERALG